MTFTFSTKSTQTSTDFQGDKAKISMKELKQIEYVDKLNIGSINERGVDDLTGASYVMDKPNSWLTAAKCEYVSEMAAWTFGTIAGGVATVFTGGVLSAAVGLAVKGAVKSGARMALGEACLRSSGQEKGFREMVVEAIIDTVTDEDENDNESNEGDNGGGNEGDNGGGNGGDNDGDGDGDNGDGNGDNGDGNQGEEADSAPAEQEKPTEEEKGTNGDAGGDEGNPNPYEDGSQGATSKPTIGPAPGDIGGRYNNMFNPGAERGFTPGDDGGDGNPGNPWDRNERMSTPSDNGDPIDPLTGFGGPSGPQVDDGNPIDPDEDFDSSGPGDDLWKPNPDDIWGGGPTSKIVGFIQIEDDKSMAKLVNAMSSDLTIF
ncbi:hypothetical protein OAZ24_00555 [Synechococcus sp. AH-736-G21]|nr:hypothetical protein [Synechococcus sp. AH-736-G21]